MDSGADLRDVLEVDALDGEVVLLFLLLGDQDAFGGIDSFVGFEAKEVLDLDGLTKIKGTLPFSMTLTTMGKWLYARTILNL